GLDDAGLRAEAQRGLAALVFGNPRRAVVDTRLAAVLKGEPPEDNAERLDLAQRAYDTKRDAAAATLFAEALAADPKLAEPRQAQHLYKAACCAALAGCGQGMDDPKPDEAERARLRKQSLGWLKADLAAWSKRLDPGSTSPSRQVARTLAHWKSDADIAGLR